MIIVSAVLPVFNGSKTLVNCITSILKQDYKNIEIIAVNDGSLDGSLDILKLYKDRIRIFNQKNSGVSSARNKGVDAATGDFIAFIDQDDAWKPDKISKQISCIDNDYNVYFVFSDFKRYDHINQSYYQLSNSQLNSYIYDWPETYPLSDKNKTKRFSHPYLLGLILKGYPIYPSTMLIKKDGNYSA